MIPMASTSGLISYPTASSSSSVSPPAPPAPPAPPQFLKDRLYVGNLHPTVDEYTLLQLFSKHGKVSKLDFLFHKTGPAKGKPRGYAFVEYSSKEDALKALVALHDRLVRGRKIVVTFAHQAPQLDTSSRPHRRPGTDTSKPTTLSLLKTHNRPEATEDKIAALEAKLRQMEHTPSSSASLTVLPSSLPQKPLLSPLPSVPAGGVQRKPGAGSNLSLPPKPKLSPAPGPSLKMSSRPSSRPSSAASHRHTSSSLGISIKR